MKLVESRTRLEKQVILRNTLTVRFNSHTNYIPRPLTLRKIMYFHVFPGFSHENLFKNVPTIALIILQQSGAPRPLPTQFSNFFQIFIILHILPIFFNLHVVHGVHIVHSRPSLELTSTVYFKTKFSKHEVFLIIVS